MPSMLFWNRVPSGGTVCLSVCLSVVLQIMMTGTWLLITLNNPHQCLERSTCLRISVFLSGPGPQAQVQGQVGSLRSTCYHALSLSNSWANRMTKALDVSTMGRRRLFRCGRLQREEEQPRAKGTIWHEFPLSLMANKLVKGLKVNGGDGVTKAHNRRGTLISLEMLILWNTN